MTTKQMSSYSTATYLALLFLGLAAGVKADVTDVNPDGEPTEPRFGGRALGITVHPSDPSVAFIATERGGFFSSTDGGTTWSHIEAIPVPMARDILFDPQDASIVIASGRYDGRVMNQGGIWRSIDGGVSWGKPATSNPGCTAEASTWGIAIPDDASFNQFVYVATDCGIAMSNDSGASWTHADPCSSADAAFCDAQSAYFDVAANVVDGQVQVDVCGDEGVFRSTDGGANWSAPDPNSPARRVNGGSFNPCKIDTAPGNPDTVYLANYSGTTPSGFCTSRLMESAIGGAAGSWTDMEVSANNCRDPWVVTHPDQGGDPDLFEVYFGDSVRMRRQVCDGTATPRCLTGDANWPTADAGSHSDTSDVEFDPTVANGCPIFLTSDGGNATSSDCGANWDDGNRGLHALDVVTFSGTLQGGGLTDLYAGTQDNGIYVTQDNSTTWSRPVGADGYNVLSDREAPARVFYRQCFGCNNFIADSGIVGAVAFPDPPGTIPTFAVATQFGPLSYAFITNDGGTPAQWTAYVTTDEGVTWDQLGPSPLPGAPGEIKAAGPSASPTFYLRLNVGGQRRIYSLSGSLDSTATLALANAGLVFPTGAWDVDPSDPTLLYASDIGNNQVMFSTDGGGSWNPDAALTNLVTQNGVYQFNPNSFPSQVSGIGIDPNSGRILVGTRTAGWYASVTDGQVWVPVGDSGLIPRAEEFFFDPDNGEAYAATRGRGIWRVELPLADLTIAKTVSADPAEKGEPLSYTVDYGNDGPDDAEEVVITDVLPGELAYDSVPAACTESAGTLTCDLGTFANGATGMFEITGTVSCAIPDGTTITNTAVIASALTADEDLSNNESTVSVQAFDSTPPVIESLTVSPDTLWPPNHKMVTVTAGVVATDTCDPNPVCTIVGVTSDEPVNGTGDGNTEPDWVLSGALTVDLRSERAGTQDGRTYTIEVTCTDQSGNESDSATAEVNAPHDRGKP